MIYKIFYAKPKRADEIRHYWQQPVLPETVETGFYYDSDFPVLQQMEIVTHRLISCKYEWDEKREEMRNKHGINIIRAIASCWEIT